MPRGRVIQNSFNAGEISHLMEGRTDFPRYANSAFRLENCIIHTQGGVSRRWGMKYVAATKAATESVLIPFLVSDTVNYALEFGNAYIRVFQNGAPVVVASTSELVTNGTFNSDLTGWTATLVHNGRSGFEAGGMHFNGSFIGPVYSDWEARRYQSLTTVAGTTYTLRFKVIYGTVGLRVGTTNLLGDLLAGATYVYSGSEYVVTFVATTTASVVQFYIGNPYGIGGECLVDDVSCFGGAVPVEIVTTYLPAELFEIQFAQSADVMYLVHPNHPVRKLSRLNAAGTSWDLRDVTFLPPPSFEKKRAPATTLTMSAVSGTGKLATTADAYWLAADVGSIITSGVARAVITGYNSTTEVDVDILDAFASTSAIAANSWSVLGSPATKLTIATFPFPIGASITLTLTDAGWRAGDVGKYVRAFGGCIKLTGWTSTTLMTGVVQSALTSLPSTPYETLANTWTLEEGAWSATNGYPSAVSFYEQRLFFGGSIEQPQTIWGSAIADFENFATGVAATDSVAYTIASNEINTFRWMSPSRVLLIGALAREFRASGGSSAITPSNIDIRGETSYGSKKRRPVQIGHTTIFIHSAGRKIRELQYNFDSDAYKADDFTVLNPDISEGGFQQIAYSQEPYSILYAVRNDGQLCALTYEKSQEVMGWARIVTDGLIESACALPPDATTGECPIYFIVNRTINGAAARYVEMFDSDLSTDCAKAGTLAAAGTAISGLSHLEGETVTVIGDGMLQASKVVASGAITAAVALTTYEIGMPYTGTVVTTRPEMQVQGQSSQAKPKRWANIYVRVHDTVGIKLNGDRLWLDAKPKNYQTAVPTPETGDLRGNVMGIDGDARLTIEMDLPFPATVLMVVGEMSVGD